VRANWLAGTRLESARVKVYRYVKASDGITERARPQAQIKALYASVVAQVTIRTVNELLRADKGDHIDTVVFNGVVDTTDPGSGQRIRPCLVTVRTTAQHQPLPVRQDRNERWPTRPAALLYGPPPRSDMAPVEPDLTRPERRSWRLHGKISSHLTESNLGAWRPTIKSNLQRLSRSVRGEPHRRNLDRWNSLVEHGDLQGLHRILTGLDRDSIEMRDVSPMGGLLSESERKDILQAAN
jgi:hypothetical protein